MAVAFFRHCSWQSRTDSEKKGVSLYTSYNRYSKRRGQNCYCHGCEATGELSSNSERARRALRDVAQAAAVPVLRREEPVAEGSRLQPVDLPGVLEYSTMYTFLAQPHYIDMRTFGHELHEVYDALFKG